MDWLNENIYGCVLEWMDRWMNRWIGCIYVWVNGWRDRWLDRWIDRWDDWVELGGWIDLTGGWIYRSMGGCRELD